MNTVPTDLPPLKLPRGAEEQKTSTAYGGWWGRIKRADGTLSRAQWLGFPDEEYTATSRKARAKAIADYQDMRQHQAAECLPELRHAIAGCMARGYYRLTNSASMRLSARTGFLGIEIAKAAKTSISQIIEEITVKWLAAGKTMPRPKRM